MTELLIILAVFLLVIGLIWTVALLASSRATARAERNRVKQAEALRLEAQRRQAEEHQKNEELR